MDSEGVKEHQWLSYVRLGPPARLGPAMKLALSELTAIILDINVNCDLTVPLADCSLVSVMIIDTVQIQGEKVILVPYKTEHVAVCGLNHHTTTPVSNRSYFNYQKYHAWMENETLRELTASERLTLDEEYEMQSMRIHSSPAVKLRFFARKMAA